MSLNPIIRRYCRARLRPQALGVAITVTLLFTGFIFFIVRTASMHRGGMLPIDAERTPILPLMGIQALILFFLGTGQVAGGITGEADEGVLDYQRLTPMRSWAKVFGYWLGLPVREWLMFAVTLPFSAWCFWRGEVPWTAWAFVYAIFITSALLYHLTGLTAGMVIKNRRWAFLMSMGIILLLYTIMPQISKFGLLFFDYITIWPVLKEHWHHFIPREAGGVVKMIHDFNPRVKFYGIEFREIIFTLFCQGGVMLTLATMVWRRWDRAESHLLGKVWAVGLYAWIQLLLLGNGLPMIESGGLFPSRAFTGRFSQLKLSEPSLAEGIGVIGLYGFVTMLILLVLAFIITPSIENQWRGLRRSRKLALSHVPYISDAAGSRFFLMAMIFVGTASWHRFASEMTSSRWFPGHALPIGSWVVFGMVLANAVLFFHALYEGWGGRRLFFGALLLGILPAMIGFVLGTASDSLLPLATWLNALSPASGPVFASCVLISATDLPIQVARAVPRAFWFCQIVTLLGTLWLQMRLRALHLKRLHEIRTSA